MATDDCYEIGSGSCPCGQGIITIERCIPDHPWAKAHQAWYKNKLVCKICEQNFAFFARSYGEPARLVLKSELQERDAAEEGWHKKIREIESMPAFKELSRMLAVRLAQERSAAARYRLLKSAGLAFGLSLQRYRKLGFEFRVANVGTALTFLRVQSPELVAKVAEADRLWDQCQLMPAGIKTSISGLEM